MLMTVGGCFDKPTNFLSFGNIADVVVILCGYNVVSFPVKQV